MEWKKNEIVGGVLLVIGIALLFAAVGTDEAKSFMPNNGLASDTTLFILTGAGFINIAAGAKMLTKKGGAHGKRRAKRT